MSSSTPTGSIPSEPVSRLEGRMLGRYRLLAHIANGGMASVHVARAEGTLGFERLVAVKLLHPHLAGEPEFVHMIADEARMAARIRNPKVVATLDVDEDPELGLYLVMEYVEGDHLGSLLRALNASGEAMPPAVAVRIVLDLLEGLGAAHELTDAYGAPTPIIHRDVSPHNVLVGVDGMSRLADFGVARAEARLTQTQEGRFKGKIAYMAPEQLADGVADVRSDLFAAGIVLWETLTGSRLFRAESTAQILKRLLHDPIPRVDALDPTLAPLADVVAKALARDPNERFASASEMANALAEAATGTVGIAEMREVGRLVRAVRGLMLAERATRVRSSVESFGPPPEPTSITRRTPLPGSVTSPGVPSRVRAVATGARETTPAPARGRVSPRQVGAVLAGVVLLAGIGAIGARAGESPARAATAGARTVAPPPDADAVLREGIAPGIAAELATVTPTVVLRLTVGADGRVIEATPFQPRAELATLERDAVAAVAGYRFTPAYRGGRAVQSELNLPIRFERVRGPDHVVRIKGSDTIGGSLGPALAHAFRSVRPDVHVIIEALGTSTAFPGLFDGSADLGAASRPISASEAAQAEALGLALEETVIGYDGIAIVVHPSSPIAALSMDQLAGIFAGRITDRAALGLAPGPIRLLGRPDYSGTHKFFEDRVLKPNLFAFADGIEELEHSDAIVHAVAGDPNAIAYVGASYVNARVKMLPIAARGSAPVAAAEATIRDGTYPIYRPLLVYSIGSPSGAAADFLRFALSAEGHAIVRRSGFVPSAARIPEPRASGAQSGTPGFVLHLPFAAGTTHLSTASAATLDAIVAYVRAHPGARVLVTGHADAEGTEADNVRLGMERARAVTSALVRMHVPVSAITTDSRGSSVPIATNGDAEGKARNRRVDVIVVGPRR